MSYRTRVVTYYNVLWIICGHAVADGRHSLSCFDIDFESEGRNNAAMNNYLFVCFERNLWFF